MPQGRGSRSWATRRASAGRRAGSILPPTPPPDIDLEAWRASTDRILAWDPDILFLTHFGPQPAPEAHVKELWERLDAWSARVHGQLAQESTDDARAKQFVSETVSELKRSVGAAEADAYAAAARFDLSWLGLARYWRKRSAPGQG